MISVAVPSVIARILLSGVRIVSHNHIQSAMKMNMKMKMSQGSDSHRSEIQI